MSRSLRLTEAQARALRSYKDFPEGCIKRAAAFRDTLRGKYRNEPHIYNGIRYGSKLEARYAQQLDNEWHAGSVLWYTRQVPFVLEGGVTYRADFLVVRPFVRDKEEGFVAPHQWPSLIEVVDSTGVMTQTKFNKLKQVQARYGIVVLIQQQRGTLRAYFDVKPQHRRSAR